MLITWSVPGGIELPVRTSWKLDLLTAYDAGNRPVAQYSRKQDTVTVSYIIFPNLSGKPSGQGCRADVIDPLADHMRKDISNRADDEIKSDSGVTIATTFYQLDMHAGGHKQSNLFGFAGNAKACAEIHVSNVTGSDLENAAMHSLVAAFHPNLDYEPTITDRLTIASLLFAGNPTASIPFYGTAVELMPPNADLTERRVATDQLVMSLGMSGDIKSSRHFAEEAVKLDPDYPLNYYNLACGDAEEGKARDAQLHLQQAFDRRANVIKGETFPDPAKDDSFLKLKKDKTFWAFVQSLSNQLKAAKI